VTAPRLLIATTNRGKLREVRAILTDSPIELCTLEDFPGLSEAVEDGATFEENAKKKALHYHGLTGMTTLADDSGLEVDALGGAPGVHSARFAGKQGDDAANNAKLVALLGGVPRERRTARFRCVMALAHEGNIAATAEGAVDGLIVDIPAGAEGFGYDPHFLLPDLALTKAQLPLEIKNRLSHRGQALRAILPAILRTLRV
jgi:XTP/dITP diphosphohydrolase